MGHILKLFTTILRLMMIIVLEVSFLPVLRVRAISNLALQMLSFTV